MPAAQRPQGRGQKEETLRTSGKPNGGTEVPCLLPLSRVSPPHPPGRFLGPPGRTPSSDWSSGVRVGLGESQIPGFQGSCSRDPGSQMLVQPQGQRDMQKGVGLWSPAGQSRAPEQLRLQDEVGAEEEDP